jgi:FlaA1/EpsC-like NDP-sugar epimerase
MHGALTGLGYLLAFLLRFESRIPSMQWNFFLSSVGILVVVRVVFFGLFHVHQGLWRYVGIRDLVDIFKAVSIGSLVFAAVLLGLYGFSFPRSVLLIEWLVCFALIAGARVFIRILRETTPALREESSRRALVVGAGDAGERLIREINRDPSLNYSVVGVVDDSPLMQRKRIHGVQVVGTIDSLPSLCSQHDVGEVLLAIPSATNEERSRTIARCRQSSVVVRTVPSVSDLWSGRAQIGELQRVNPEDLLGRRPVTVDKDGLTKQLSGQAVMVTGAGGSIGSELCRQLADLRPKILIAFDQAETNLYWLQQELGRSIPDLRVAAVVGDILDTNKLNEVMALYRPEVVYHAAAYKHVPMMEQNVLEAIKNNVFGTQAVALSAEANAVQRFVLISTDKAVHPISIMGMSKRVAEDLLLSRNGSSTRHVTVRFGNVLGSAGSVLPLFQWQMAMGGPVTVTDPEATRYFMLIAEAAQLVIQASAMGAGGEIFLLDMGTPVPVMQLAQDLMRLSGINPSSDMSVETVGLRPGEKLREELVRESEEFRPSGHEKILMVLPGDLDNRAFEGDLMRLRMMLDNGDEARARSLLREMAQRSVDAATQQAAEARR